MCVMLMYLVLMPFFPVRFLNNRLPEIKILKFFLVPIFRHFLTSAALMVSKHQPSLPQPLTF